MALTPHERGTLEDALPQIEAILTLAKANFPGTHQVRIETVGSSPTGSVSVPYYVLSRLCELARRALTPDA